MKIARLAASRRSQRALGTLASLVLAAGALLIAFPVLAAGHDHLHGRQGSQGRQGSRGRQGRQGQLRVELGSATSRRARLDGSPGTGRGTTRILIPELGLDVVVVQATAAALRAGVGHYPGTPMPCSAGDVGIAGHRTTYGRPFSNINLLGPGDLVVFQTPVGSCAYRVDRPPFVVSPYDWAVVANTPGRSTLTLSSCAPKGSATERIVVKAVMVTSETRN